MKKCTCTNCVFTGNGQRYCYDCGKYSPAPTSAELELQINAIKYAYLDIAAMSDRNVDIDELSDAASQTKVELEVAFPWLVEYGKGYE